MQTEYEKMLAGELYNANDEALLELRVKARTLLQRYNQSPFDQQQRALILKELLAGMGSNIDIQAPFYCDYGCHIEVGDNFFANFNCVFLDCNHIKIGNTVFMGPGVHIYAASHPVIASERIKGPELAYPVVIGDHCWIGGGSIICAGVEIGANTTIGAGSVVTKSIPANVLAAGNPCKVIRTL